LTLLRFGLRSIPDSGTITNYFMPAFRTRPARAIIGVIVFIDLESVLLDPRE